MTLSIIVTNYKTPELLKLCLKSIKETVKGIGYEVLVMDAQTDEDTEYVIKGLFSEFIFFPFRKNIGFRALVNEGIKNSSGEFILILNSDIVLTDGAVKNLIEYLAQNKEVGIVGPQLLSLNGSIQDSCLRFFGPLTVLARRTIFGKTAMGKRLISWFLMKDYDHKGTKEVDWMLGSSLLVRREAVEKVGLMDERFFMYFEDVDWCRRFHLAGFKIVYLPEAKMYHYHLRVSKKTGGIRDLFINKYTWIHIVSAVKYYWKYGIKTNRLNTDKLQIKHG